MRRMITIVVLLGAASVSPLIFPLAESGRSTMDTLAKLSLLPSVALIGLFGDFSIAVMIHSQDQWQWVSQRGLLPQLHWRRFDCPDSGLALCPEIFPG